MAQWRKGDRVIHVPSNQAAVVMRRKGKRVQIHWGTTDNRLYTDWVSEDELVRIEDMVEIVL